MSLESFRTDKAKGSCFVSWPEGTPTSGLAGTTKRAVRHLENREGGRAAGALLTLHPRLVWHGGARSYQGQATEKRERDAAYTPRMLSPPQMRLG